MALAISSRKSLIALLSVVLVAAVAAAAEPARAAKAPDVLVISSVELPASGGFSVSAVEVREPGRPADTAIVAKRGRVSATYEVSGDLEPGIRADLGELGRVDLRFHRRERQGLPLDKNCRIVLESGVYRGEFTFAGEGGYATASASSALGEVLRFTGRGCEEESLARPNFQQVVSNAIELSARARRPNGSVELEAGRGFLPKVELTAVVREKAGRVEIRREATAAPGTVLRAGRGKAPRWATLRPKRPFRGAARFVRNSRSGKTRWLGSLRVSLPGLEEEVPLAGPDFVARACRGLRVLQSGCRAPRPPAPGSAAQISGSQSQDFGDARLSWSR